MFTKLLFASFVWNVAYGEDLASSPPLTSLPFCQTHDLTFDDTPGVFPPETRGLLLPFDYYKSVGISHVACVRKDKTSASSTCRLFDTNQPVGHWSVPPCNCTATTCRSASRCGDPDLQFDGHGNVLIIEEQSLTHAPSFPPDDNAFGGTIQVEFAFPTNVLSIGFMDIEAESPVILEVCIVVLVRDRRRFFV